jgi:hypothetical protein
MHQYIFIYTFQGYFKLDQDAVTSTHKYPIVIGILKFQSHAILLY